MAADSNPAVCTHPNALVWRVVEGWDVQGYPDPGVTNRVEGVCPDCAWIVKSELRSAGGVGAPSGLAAAAATGSSPTASSVLTWARQANADSYVVQKSTDGGTTWVAGVPATAAQATSPTVTETGLATGTLKFRVAAKVHGVTGAWSNVATLVVS